MRWREPCGSIDPLRSAAWLHWCHVPHCCIVANRSRPFPQCSNEVRGRIELSTLAVCRYGLRVRDIAALTNKHRNSVTKWLNKGLRRERVDPEFKKRLDNIDAGISRNGE